MIQIGYVTTGLEDVTIPQGLLIRGLIKEASAESSYLHATVISRSDAEHTLNEIIFTRCDIHHISTTEASRSPSRNPRSTMKITEKHTY